MSEPQCTLAKEHLLESIEQRTDNRELLPESIKQGKKRTAQRTLAKEHLLESIEQRTDNREHLPKSIEQGKKRIA